MNFGVCCLSVIPVRADASHRSEMVSQLLFGETFSIDSFSNGWAKIVIDHDGYEGWIDEKQLVSLSGEEHTKILSGPRYYSIDLVDEMIPREGRPIQILPGSILYNPSASDFSLGGKSFSFIGHSIKADIPPTIDDFLIHALRFLNSPYLWGGRTPFGIDCSGFVQLVARLSGMALPRDTQQQVEIGELIHSISEAKPGDIAFFDNAEGRIIHVGILLPDAQIIHASGKVRIDTLDQKGIFAHDTQKYSHQLRVIKRIFK